MKRFTLYILHSNETGRFYTGQTTNLHKRLEKHRNRQTSFGKRNRDIEVIYTKTVASLSEARKLEHFIKRQKSHTFIDRLIKNEITPP